MTRRQQQNRRLDQAAWLCEIGFDHTADVLLYWHEEFYEPMPPPRDEAQVVKITRIGILPGGPS